MSVLRKNVADLSEKNKKAVQVLAYLNGKKFKTYLYTLDRIRKDLTWKLYHAFKVFSSTHGKDFFIMTEYFTDNEIKETLLDNLDGYKGIEDYYFDNVFDDLFNTGEYFIGYQVAADALEKYGIFKAIEEVQNFDCETWGHWYTDASNPEALANTLEYIHANEYMQDMLDRAGLELDDETTPENVNKLIKTLKEY